ncbi:hypothetical protein KY359_01490 [Candidatus Woesearchaeota archaeon]|nr:hypothetical protein [Candidatus Woesearchaeota archaeon]
MNKMAIIAILVIALFLAGCASQEITVAGEKSGSTSAKSKTTTTSSQEKTGTTTTTSTRTASASEPEEEESTGRGVTIQDTDTGHSATFISQGDPFRDKGLSEKCDLDFPFECARYSATNGIVYITVKNQDYSSKADEVTLYLDGDACDPSDTFIETGQNKYFECYVDPDADYVSGNLEMEYYVPTTKSHRTETGSITVLME